ncbi:hypothetical protein, partial [Clostridioides difficile]|uniref:hypothetical protein n=1 Tax=Clostridioides difficile TaxID=1496 RepID=UPI001A9A62EC
LEVLIHRKNLINQYFKFFGRTAYEFDFAYSSPQETLTPTFESLITLLSRIGESLFLRQSNFNNPR